MKAKEKPYLLAQKKKATCTTPPWKRACKLREKKLRKRCSGKKAGGKGTPKTKDDSSQQQKGKERSELGDHAVRPRSIHSESLAEMSVKRRGDIQDWPREKREPNRSLNSHKEGRRKGSNSMPGRKGLFFSKTRKTQTVSKRRSPRKKGRGITLEKTGRRTKD